MNVPIWITTGFQQRNTQDTQNLKKDTFCWLPVTSPQFVIATEKYTDAGILLNYDDDAYSQGYARNKEAFRALTKNDILQPYISVDDFRSTKDSVVAIGYNLYVSDIRY